MGATRWGALSYCSVFVSRADEANGTLLEIVLLVEAGDVFVVSEALEVPVLLSSVRGSGGQPWRLSLLLPVFSTCGRYGLLLLVDCSAEVLCSAVYFILYMIAWGGGSVSLEVSTVDLTDLVLWPPSPL